MLAYGSLREQSNIKKGQCQKNENDKRARRFHAFKDILQALNLLSIKLHGGYLPKYFSEAGTFTAGQILYDAIARKNYLPYRLKGISSSVFRNCGIGVFFGSMIMLYDRKRLCGCLKRLTMKPRLLFDKSYGDFVDALRRKLESVIDYYNTTGSTQDREGYTRKVAKDKIEELDNLMNISDDALRCSAYKKIAERCGQLVEALPSLQKKQIEKQYNSEIKRICKTKVYTSPQYDEQSTVYPDYTEFLKAGSTKGGLHELLCINCCLQEGQPMKKLDNVLLNWVKLFTKCGRIESIPNYYIKTYKNNESFIREEETKLKRLVKNYDNKFHPYNIHKLSVNYPTISPFIGGPICNYWNERYHFEYEQKQSRPDISSKEQVQYLSYQDVENSMSFQEEKKSNISLKQRQSQSKKIIPKNILQEIKSCLSNRHRLHPSVMPQYNFAKKIASILDVGQLKGIQTEFFRTFYDEVRRSNLSLKSEQLSEAQLFELQQFAWIHKAYPTSYLLDKDDKYFIDQFDSENEKFYMYYWLSSCVLQVLNVTRDSNIKNKDLSNDQHKACADFAYNQVNRNIISNPEKQTILDFKILQEAQIEMQRKVSQNLTPSQFRQVIKQEDLHNMLQKKANDDLLLSISKKVEARKKEQVANGLCDQLQEHFDYRLEQSKIDCPYSYLQRIAYINVDTIVDDAGLQEQVRQMIKQQDPVMQNPNVSRKNDMLYALKTNQYFEKFHKVILADNRKKFQAQLNNERRKAISSQTLRKNRIAEQIRYEKITVETLKQIKQIKLKTIPKWWGQDPNQINEHFLKLK